MLLRAGEVISRPRRWPARRRPDRPARPPSWPAARPGWPALLGLDREHNGVDVHRPGVAGAAARRATRSTRRPVCTGPRVGVAAAHDRPWRFWVAGSPAVSPYRPGRRAGTVPGDRWGSRYPVRNRLSRRAEGSAAVGRDILDELEWRGLIAQSTDRDALRRDLTRACSRSTAGSTRPRRACTPATSSRCSPCAASSRPGARPIVLAGGATGLIGDPRDTGERTLNAADDGRRLGAADPRPAGAVRRVRRLADRGAGGRTTWTGPAGSRPWSSCATSASTSRST